jgi:uncharacterized integral membrane protein (TIGR00698 family)
MTRASGNSPTFARIYFIAAIIAIVVFRLSPTVALLMGIACGIFFVNPYPSSSRTWTKILLQGSIIGLGFGMDFRAVMEAGRDGFVFTLVTITLAIGVGYVLGRMLNVERVISYLVSVGTAICGGSAIAAVSQVMNAGEKEISVSIGIVFILNAVALLLFPVIGEMAGLSQYEFGLWAAIAIHDTSSVVGAASHYGNEALMTATTIKLSRALWIIPVALLTSLVFGKQSKAKLFPWFIFFFLVASLVNTYVRLPGSATTWILIAAKTGFSATLFLIGSGISVEKIRSVGLRPLLQGIILWVLIVIASLLLIMHN